MAFLERVKVKRMVVEVRLFATLREGRFKKRQMEFPQRCTFGDLLKHLKIPAEAVGILLLNGRAGSVESLLSPHDVVSIFPSLGGG